jgi:hypothetical protein
VHLSPDECRRLERLLFEDARGGLDSGLEHEMRMLIAREDSNATLFDWTELTRAAETIVRERAPPP